MSRRAAKSLPGKYAYLRNIEINTHKDSLALDVNIIQRLLIQVHGGGGQDAAVVGSKQLFVLSLEGVML